MLDFPSLIRFFSFLLPIPFMLLFYLKTRRLNYIPPLLPLLLTITFIIGVNFYSYCFGYSSLGFTSDLLTFYSIMLYFSFFIFRLKYDFPQALSIAFCLTYFASLYWELPYHTYTILQRGFDAAFSLHLLYSFPAVFIWSKIQLKIDKPNILLVITSLGLSSLLMILLVDLGVDFVWKYENPPGLQQLTEMVWIVSRFICFISLYIIFYRGQLRVKKIKN